MAKKQVAADEFLGFPEAGFRFLRQLKQNNERDWFRERKTDYETYVEEPMKALVLAVAKGCQAKGIPMHAKEKSPVMRIYRDIRFSKDKQPYKTHVGADLRRSFSESEGLMYIHISPEESFVASGVYQPDRLLLQAWREAIVSDPGRFQKMQAALSSKGLDLHSEKVLSKLPRGFQNYAGQPVEGALKMTSFTTSKKFTAAECFNPNLVKTIVDFAIAAKPLLDFAWRVEETHAKTQRKRLRAEELV